MNLLPSSQYSLFLFAQMDEVISEWDILKQYHNRGLRAARQTCLLH